MRRALPVREQRRRRLPQSEAPEPGKEAGAGIIGTAIFDRLTAEIALEVRGSGAGFSSGRCPDGTFTLQAEHVALPVAIVGARLNAGSTIGCSKPAPFLNRRLGGTEDGRPSALRCCFVMRYGNHTQAAPALGPVPCGH